jgi:hypothetical protein
VSDTPTNQTTIRNPYAISHNLPTGAALGWRPRPSYGRIGWLPYASKDRDHGWRPWRKAREFEPLKMRLYGNRLCCGGDPWGAYRKGMK